MHGIERTTCNCCRHREFSETRPCVNCRIWVFVNIVDECHSVHGEHQVSNGTRDPSLRFARTIEPQTDFQSIHFADISAFIGARYQLVDHFGLRVDVLVSWRRCTTDRRRNQNHSLDAFWCFQGRFESQLASGRTAHEPCRLNVEQVQHRNEVVKVSKGFSPADDSPNPRRS